MDERWCLVHATHLTRGEVDRMAESGAVAGLCLTTEANLGDGLFPLAPFLERGGRFGIGSDSHVSTSPVEELRWLEYGQRLAGQRRNVAVTTDERRVGDHLWRAALAGGAQAAGRQVGALAPAHAADLLVLDEAHPNVSAPPELLNGFIFSGNDNLVKDVLAGGQWVKGFVCEPEALGQAVEITPFGGWRAQEAVTREQGWAGFTTGAAFAGFAEDKIGRIAVGMRADFLIIDRDPLLAAAGDLRTTKVIETWVGGDRVWQRK